LKFSSARKKFFAHKIANVNSRAHTFGGGFIGGGTEVAVAAVPGLYWRNEYRFAAYGSADLQFFASGTPTGTFNHETKTVQTITTSLVWKFH
jgi:hypothetical protein